MEPVSGRASLDAFCADSRRAAGVACARLGRIGVAARCLSQKLNAGWNAKHADTQNTGEKPTLMKQLMSHLPPAQQEGAGKNPAIFAVDALQGGQAKNAQLCRPGTPLCGQVSSP